MTSKKTGKIVWHIVTYKEDQPWSMTGKMEQFNSKCQKRYR